MIRSILLQKKYFNLLSLFLVCIIIILISQFHPLSHPAIDPASNPISPPAIAQTLEPLLIELRTAQAQDNLTANPNPSIATSLHLQKILFQIRERNRLESHLAPVFSVSYRPDGQMIASSSDDRTIKLWQSNGHLLTTLTGHQAGVNAIAFSPKGNLLVSASQDGIVKLWRIPTSSTIAPSTIAPTVLATLPTEQGAIEHVTFRPDGKAIATAGHDHTVKLWQIDGANYALIHTLKGHQATVMKASFSADGQWIVTASDDQTVKLWRTETGELVRSLSGHRGAVYSAEFSSDGQRIITASHDHTIKLWNLQGDCLKTLEGHGAPVYQASFSRNHIVSVGGDGRVRFWTNGGDAIAAFAGHTSAIYSFSIDPTGQRLASASQDQSIRIWQMPGTAEFQQRVAANSPELFRLDSSPIQRVDWNLKGEVAAASEGVRVVNPQGEPMTQFSIDQEFCLSDSMPPLFNKQLSNKQQIDLDQTVQSQIRDLQKNNLPRDWEERRSHPSSQSLGRFKTCRSITAVAWSPDGQSLALASRDGTAQLWTSTGKLYRTLVGHQDRVWQVQWSPEQSMVLTASGDRTLKLWEQNGTLMTTLKGHKGAVLAGLFSPDGQQIASAGMDGTIRLWNRAGAVQAVLTKHRGAVYRLAYSPDGKLLASAGADGTVRLWNTAGELLTTLLGHQGSVYAVQFSPDSRVIASAGADGIVYLWNTAGNLIAKIEAETLHPEAILDLQFSINLRTKLSSKVNANSQWLYSVRRDRTFQRWRLDLEALRSQSCDWLQDYLNSNPNVGKWERSLCAISHPTPTSRS